MVSIKQIAREVGVSPATVSNALTGKGRVSRATQAQIQDAARAMGYRPSLAGRALQSGQTGILGLVMPDLTNPLFPRIAQHLADAADGRGLGILIADSRGSAAEQSHALRRLVARGVDGLLVVPQKGSSADLHADPQPVPLVTINTASDPRNTISADHAGGGRLAARHICDLGHRHVVILGGDPVSEVQRDRIEGMQVEFGTDVASDLLWGAAAFEQMVARIETGATAVMTTSDLLALQVQSHLTRSGLVVPRDVSLTGFDDLPLATAMHPMLTTVAQDVETTAHRAIEIMADLVARPRTPGTPPPPAPAGQAVPMRLIPRQSSTSPVLRSARPPRPDHP